MNCLRFTTRTGLLALAAVLLVVGMMPALAHAAEDEKEFDPFALDAMIAASLGGPANPVIAPAGERPMTLRTPKLLVPCRKSLRSPFRPGPVGGVH